MRLSSIPKWLERAYSAERAFRSTKGASLLALSNGLEVNQDENIDRCYQEAVLERISDSYNKSKSALVNVPELYQPGSKWKPQIERERREYIQALSNKDIPLLTSLFENFFRNSGSISILKKSLYPQLTRHSPLRTVVQKEFIAGVLHDIRIWKDNFPQKGVDDLSLPLIGNPFGYKIDGVIVTGSSACQNYYAKQSATLISDKAVSIVAEIGGGFGGLFYYLLNENSSVKCLNFDLLEVLAISQYFLLMAFPEKHFLLFGEPGSEGWLTGKIISDFDVILLPNYKLVDLDDNSVDLFLNFHSLSEMDRLTIEEYIKQITRVTRGYFYHENSTVAKNIGYGKLEVPVEDYPLSPSAFKLIYKKNALWEEKRYMEFLFRKSTLNGNES